MKKIKKIAILSSATIVATVVGSFSFVEKSINNNNHNLSNFVSSRLIRSEVVPEANLSTDEYGVEKLFINYQGIRYGIKYVNKQMGDELIVDGISRTLRDVNDSIVIQDNLTFSYEGQNYTFDVKKIKEKAFKGDIYGNSILVIGNNIKEIGDQTFQSSKFKKIIFPGNNNTSFSNTLVNVQYIKNIDRFGISSFENAQGLPEILIFDDSVVEIQSKAFSSIKYNDTTRSISYYSHKTKVDPSAFDDKFSIKVEPTKLKKLDSQIQHNNNEYQQIKIDDLSQKTEFQNIDYLKDYIIKNIDTIFENSPVKINSTNGEKSTDLLKENISFNLEISEDKRKIYLTNLSLDYWYDENGNIIQNTKHVFGNLVLTQTIKKTDIKNPINANVLGLGSYTAIEAKDKITSNLLFNFKDYIFSGDSEILSSSDFENLNIVVEGKNLKVTFILKENTWYDEEGKLGTNEKEFQTLIHHFKDEVTHTETKIINPIDASIINLNNKTINEALNSINENFIFLNLSKFFTGSHEINNVSKINIVSKVMNGKKIDLVIELSERTAYDSSGNLLESKKTFNTSIYNFKQEVQNEETKIINPIQASILGIANLSAKDAQSQITQQFILNNKNKFFTGYLNLQNVSEIIDLNVSISNNELIVSFKLKQNTWAGEDGQIGTFDKLFTTKITNFKEIETKIETQINNPIEASSLGLNSLTAEQARTKINASLIFNYKDQIFNGDNNISSEENIIRIEMSISNNTISLSFYLVSLTWYDENGRLGNGEKIFETKIINFKEEIFHKPTIINNPIDAIRIDLGDKNINDALNLIDNNFIFNNIDKFFSGDYEINRSSQIYINSKVITDEKIKLVISLEPKSYYDENGQLGNEEKLFTTFIFNFKKEEQKQETKIINPIESSKIGLSIYTAEEAKNQITNEFIYKNKNNFFEGYLNLSSANDILELSLSVSNNELIISFKLRANTWSDANGIIGTENKLFTTSIIKFKESQIKKETQINSPIEAYLINLNDLTIDEALELEFKNIIFDKKNYFFEGDHEIVSIQSIIKIDKLKEGNKLKLSIILAENTWYNNKGQLVNKSKIFETEIINFKQLDEKKDETIINNPIEASIIGLGDHYISDAINLIDSEFIFENKIKFFKGDLNISKSNQITISKKQREKNTIILTIVLASNTWYNQNGILENKTKSFETIIENFRSDQKQETKIINPIQASSLNLEYLTIEEAIEIVDDNLVYENIIIFFSGDYEINSNSIEIFSKNIVDNTIEISITLKPNTCYDKDGNLIIDKTKFTTKIINFKESPKITKTYVINPINASSIGLNNKLVKDVIDENIIDAEFIFVNKSKFIGGSDQIKYSSQISINNIEQVGNRKIKLVFTLSANSWYDENGKLSQSTITFETMLVEFQLDPNLPIDADEYDGVPWTKWWNITLLCIAATVFPLLIIWIIRKIYKIKSRK